jgi:hypothetical protein
MRARRPSNDGRAYCLAKPHSLDTYLLSQQPLARQACRYSPHFAKHPGEPPSVLAQKPWHVLSHSEQHFASAGAANARTNAAAAPSPANMSESFRKSASPIRKQCGNAKRVSAYLQSEAGG